MLEVSPYTAVAEPTRTISVSRSTMWKSPLVMLAGASE